MFKIGDKIVYPMHGAGVIHDIEEKEILGDVGSYYVLKLPIGNMRLMIPVDNYEELGLRDIVDVDTIDKVVEVLGMGQSEDESNWNKRYRKNMEKIKTGNIYDVAEVVRNLYLLDHEKGLSTGEKKMFNNAKQILVSEFVLVKNIDKEEAERFILENIK